MRAPLNGTTGRSLVPGNQGGNVLLKKRQTIPVRGRARVVDNCGPLQRLLYVENAFGIRHLVLSGSHYGLPRDTAEIQSIHVGPPKAESKKKHSLCLT